MSFTYAVQVPTGKEIDFKIMLLNLLERCGNPGIIAIHALETFTQTLGDKGMSLRRWKAKVPGYIFVTVANTERFTAKQGGNFEAGLGMDAACWQLINKIPLMKRILNRYIQHDEWKQFFDSADLEPEIQLAIPAVQHETEVQKSSKDNAAKAEFTLAELFEAAKQVLEEKAKAKADQAVAALRNAVAAVKTYTRGNRTICAVPQRLYKVLVEQHNKGSGGRMTVQGAVRELKTLLGAVIRWQT